ncbi:MAG TPA: hypothetical protein PLA98_04240, partial [Alicycliphilus sp.]|nr:hypothetical protein [Alicycliphilus sp.]
ELCITMLGAGNVIALPRYATGDMARLVPLQDAREAAAMAGVQTPWLPVALVQGRIKDRPSGLPSVEAIKELIYLDHAIADQLSGAFRLERGDGDRPCLTLQASHAQTATAVLAEQLARLCARHGLADIRVRVLAPEEFPWRPTLDYERKFDYVDAGHA